MIAIIVLGGVVVVEGEGQVKRGEEKWRKKTSVCKGVIDRESIGPETHW